MTIRIRLVYKIFDEIKTYRTSLVLQVGDKLYLNERFTKEMNEPVYNYKVGTKFLKVIIEE